MQRRDFIKLAAASAGALAVGPYVRPFIAFAQGNTPFVHGVASGDPLPGGVIIWTRVTPHPEALPGSGAGPGVTVGWEVSTNPAFTNVVRSGSLLTSAGQDHTVKVDVNGLDSSSDYFYRFLWDSFASPTGRARTAPALGASLDCMRFGVVSCSNWEGGYFSPYGHMVERDDLDFVLAVGDYLYEYEPGRYGDASSYGRAHEPPREQVSLADYRQRHAQYKSDPHLQGLHARYPFIVNWDDHEVTNDTWKDGAENHQPEEGDFHERRARAYRAYFEWMPIRLPSPGSEPTRIYRRFQFGQLADLSMLDLRQYRDKQVDSLVSIGPISPSVQKELDDPNRTITGQPQMDWLISGLQGSPTQWKLVGNPLMIAPLKMGTIPALPAGTPIPNGGIPINPDQWDGYTADRSRLLGAIAERELCNVVFLTGDIHSSWASDLPVDEGSYPLSPSVASEFICTSVTADNVDEATGGPSDALAAAALAANRHIKLCELDSHGYSVADVTPERLQFDWYYISDRSDPKATQSFASAWQTADGDCSVSEAAGPLGERCGETVVLGGTNSAPTTTPAAESLAATGRESSALGLAGLAGGLGLAAWIRSRRSETDSPAEGLSG